MAASSKEYYGAVHGKEIINVEWWGRRDDMLEVYAQCHIVCLPTTYGEGIPRALIEAAASGRPIVATDVPGCRDIVQNEYNGFLVPPNDPGAS